MFVVYSYYCTVVKKAGDGSPVLVVHEKECSGKLVRVVVKIKEQHCGFQRGPPP